MAGITARTSTATARSERAPVSRIPNSMHGDPIDKHIAWWDLEDMRAREREADEKRAEDRGDHMRDEAAGVYDAPVVEPMK